MNLDVWDQVTALFYRIENQLTEELRRSSDLGLSEFRTLKHLAEQPDLELRMQELAESLMLTQSSTTRLVERLEKRGFVFRDSCPSDKRGKYCVLNEDGKKYIEEAAPLFQDCLNRVLKKTLANKDAREAARALCLLTEA